MATIPGDVDFVAPALFDHCCRIYKAMFDEAKPVTRLHEGDPDNIPETQIMVYEGFLTQLISGKLNLSVPYYTSGLTALKNMGCIRQLKRGGGTSPSQWELIYEPSLEAFMRQKPDKKPKQSREEALEEMIDSLNGRLSQVEKTLSQIVQGLAAKYGSEPQGEDITS